MHGIFKTVAGSPSQMKPMIAINDVPTPDQMAYAVLTLISRKA